MGDSDTTTRFSLQNNSNKLRFLPNITEAIGQTPLVDISCRTKHHGLNGRISAKLRYFNPEFSKKN